MGQTGDRKRSKKKSKRSKRERAPKDAIASPRAGQSEAIPPSDQSGAATALSQASQELVIELQRTELTRLLREQDRLNHRVDQLLQLHEREQVLRQQMQAALDNLAARRELSPPGHSEPAQERLVERVVRAESKFSALQSAVGLLVVALERQLTSAPTASVQ